MKRYLSALPICLLVLIFAAAFQPQFENVARAQATSQASAFDAQFFKGMRWRNIGPNRGGRSIASTGVVGRPNEYYFGATGG